MAIRRWHRVGGMMVTMHWLCSLWWYCSLLAVIKTGRTYFRIFRFFVLSCLTAILKNLCSHLLIICMLLSIWSTSLDWCLMYSTSTSVTVCTMSNLNEKCYKLDPQFFITPTNDSTVILLLLHVSRARCCHKDVAEKHLTYKTVEKQINVNDDPPEPGDFLQYAWSSSSFCLSTHFSPSVFVFQ